MRLGDIAEVALVNAVEAQEIGCGSSCGGGVFVVPHDCRNVVTQWGDRAPMTIHRLGNDVLLGNEPGQFQIGVGDGPMRVGKGHKSRLDLGGELGAPQQWWDVAVRCGREPDATHALTSCIVGTDRNWVVRNQFGQLRGPGCKRFSQVLKVIELVPHCSGDSKAMPVHVADPFLQQGEQSPAARDSDGHAAELSQGLVPNLGGDSCLVAQGVKDLHQSLHPVRGQLQSLVESVKEPAQHHFSGAQMGVSFEKLLQRGNMLPG